MFASRNILILGDKNTGKTSLAWFLQHGKPFQIVKDEIRTPDPTLGVAIIDRKFSLQKGNWLNLKQDVPGDARLRETWRQAIMDIRPHGVVYMVDGRLEPQHIQEAVDGIFDHVLCHYQEGLRELRTLHVFVNFCDYWLATTASARETLAIVADRFGSRLAEHRMLQDIRFSAAATHLSPNKSAWPETNRALHHFGADLME